MKKYIVDVNYEVHIEAKDKIEAERIANEKIYDGEIDPNVLVVEED